MERKCLRVCVCIQRIRGIRSKKFTWTHFSLFISSSVLLNIRWWQQTRNGSFCWNTFQPYCITSCMEWRIIEKKNIFLNACDFFLRSTKYFDFGVKQKSWLIKFLLDIYDFSTKNHVTRRPTSMSKTMNIQHRFKWEKLAHNLNNCKNEVDKNGAMKEYTLQFKENWFFNE